MGNLTKNWYRESQIFEARQAHPRMILVKVTPGGFVCLFVCLLGYLFVCLFCFVLFCFVFVFVFVS